MNPGSNFSLTISPGRVSVQVCHWTKEWLSSNFIFPCHGNDLHEIPDSSAWKETTRIMSFQLLLN